MKKLLRAAAVAVTLFAVVSCQSVPMPRPEKIAKLLPVVLVLESEQHIVGWRSFCSAVALEPTVIVTAAHCVRNLDKTSFRLRLFSGEVRRVLDMKVSEKIDVAFLTVDAVPDVAKRADMSKAKPGDEVYAVGHPHGLRYTVTTGFITRLPQGAQVYSEKFPGNHIEHTAVANPGNSGGGLFNEHGELLGINNWIIPGGVLSFALRLEELLKEA